MSYLYVKYNPILGLNDYKQSIHPHECLVGHLNVEQDTEQFLILVNHLYIAKHLTSLASPPECLWSGVIFEILNN